ncbi:hypothetical protein CBR_g23543 [Chara braunii]|uniref:Uncharacterized protein n=1 Tax=Chara braunii TaxID=69332 RepID=A0A388L4I1_CHABU|nr:hypothetical protein CBR_g23543 [Chara braunii]|eukprot:GBG77216.1 hypothetical protein CBR_g23543 [Chara braunii]
MSDRERTTEDDRILLSAGRRLAHVALGPEGDRLLFRQLRERQQKQRRARAAEARRAFTSEAATSAAMATAAQQSSKASSSGTVGTTIAQNLSQSAGVMASQQLVSTPEEIVIQRSDAREAQLQKALGERKAEKERMLKRKSRMQRRRADLRELVEMDLTHMDGDVKVVRTALLDSAVSQPAQPQGTQPQQQLVQQPAPHGPQPGVAQVQGQGQWVPKTAIGSPRPFLGDKRGEDLDTWLRNQLAGKPNINVHNFPSFNKKALDLEAKIGHGHQPTTDGRKKALPPNWKAKSRIMFVDNDGSTIELDDDFQKGVGSEVGSAEASGGGAVAASIQKGEAVGGCRRGSRSRSPVNPNAPPWEKAGLTKDVWRDRYTRQACIRRGQYGHNQLKCRNNNKVTEKILPTLGQATGSSAFQGNNVASSSDLALGNTSGQ